MFYKLSVKEVLSELHSSVNGLSISEAKNRLLKYGKNEIINTKKFSIFRLFISQFQNFIIYVLLVAVLLSLFFSEYNDAIVIGIVIIINTLLGFFQEFKAEKAIESLNKLSSPMALVLRNNKNIKIPSNEVVPGDIIIINEGSIIPADARIIESVSMLLNESSLTGESLPVSKDINLINKECIISDRKNMVFLGTSCVNGHGQAIVVSTGFSTEIGKIAKDIQKSGEKFTPLQKQISKLGIFITIIVLFIITSIFLLDLFSGDSLLNSFFTSLALAVAAIPEGLPAIITITLALSTQVMLKKNVLIRRLSSVETLGSTNIICTDKTGTLTKNEMTVSKIFVNDKLLNVSGSGYSLSGKILFNNKEYNPRLIENFLTICFNCHNASLHGDSDPTEKALIVLSKKAGFDKHYSRIKEIPFSSESKFMLTVNEINNHDVSLIKGAPEVILSRCKFIEIDNKIKHLSSNDIKDLMKVYDSMASDALRVLAFAYSKNSKDFIFVGFAGMIDPPRDEVKKSIMECNNAGIRVVMITGDYELTAKAIGSMVGIKGDIINGKTLESMSIKDLEKVVDKVSIYARVNPEHKAKILQALKNKGHIVAMTGDGVNDAPALKRADIGISVGSGTDVAKQASDMVLLDDNFTSIVSAVREGRGIYSNLKKFIKFLFSTNLAEVLIILLSILLGVPLPLIAIQILVINLLTDSLPALALGVDPVNSSVMNSPPRKIDEKILSKKDIPSLLFESLIITLSVLSMFLIYYKSNSLIYAQTVAFSVMVFAELFNSLNYRLGNSSLFSMEFFKNRPLLLAIIISVIVQLSIVYIFNSLFSTVPLLLSDLLLVILASSIVLLIKEPFKLFNKTKYIMN